jgi:hypothetical protein
MAYGSATIHPNHTCYATSHPSKRTGNSLIYKFETFFCKYLPRYNHICANDSGPDHSFVFNCSINVAQEKAKEFASKMTFQQVLLHDDITPAEIKLNLPDMCMSRLMECNRITTTFSPSAPSALWLKLFQVATNQTCNMQMREQLDEYGDHCLGCIVNHKTKACNSIRDIISKAFQRILPTARLTSLIAQHKSRRKYTTKHGGLPIQELYLLLFLFTLTNLL